MESCIASDVDAVKDAIFRNGFFNLSDQTLGDNVQIMDDNDTHLASASGLRFCKDNILYNQVSGSDSGCAESNVLSA